MKPIRLTTIGKVVWFFLIVIVIIAMVAVASFLKKDEPKRNDKPSEVDSEKIIDYTESKNYEFNFDKKTGFKNDEEVITIKESGTYKIIGNNDKQRFVIDSPSGIVKLILSGFNTSVVYNFLDIRSAYKVIIELEDGSENSIVSDLLEQENVINPTIIKSNSDIEIVGNGKLTIETIGNFLESKANLSIKNATLEVNNINNGINIDGNFSMENGIVYVLTNGKGFFSGGNTTIDGGTFVIRSSDSAIKVNGVFLLNSGKIFIASLNEIQKPNANSLQKSMILNFQESRNKLLFFHDTTAVILAYAGGLDYKHILYSDDFKTESYVLYGGGKIAGTQTYGLYKPEDYAEESQLTCEGLTNDRFELKELVNIYEGIVKK